jgi:type II secretory pathway pseudopilin PulG
LKKISAFSIIELVMVIVLVSIIFAVTAPLMLAIGSGWQLAQARNELSASAMVAMDRMMREIRQVKNNTSVITAGSSSFSFVENNSNTVTYNVSGGHLMRTVGATANQLADYVSALSFTYYNAAGSVIAVPVVSPSATDITRIVIDLTFLSGTSLSFESGVSPRNL